MSRITPQPGIMDIALYQGGQSTISGVSDIVKLSSNENPYGAGEAAKEAYLKSGHDLHRYPSTDHASLRVAIAESLALDAEKIICGVGSDEVLQFVCQCYAGPGDEVIYTEHGFSMYPILAKACGALPVKVKERDRVVDVDAILAACNDRTRVVFVTNPGNPTGTILEMSELERLAETLPKTTVLVIDSAYAEFADDYDGGAAIAARHENVIMTRTFSKLHGLGGLRIGWGYGSKELIDVLNRVRQPFNLSEVQLRTAEAAMRDAEFIEKCLRENTRLRAWLTDALRSSGIEVDHSSTNFILARFASEDDADACDAALKADGIIVRKVAGYGFPNGLRITIGDEPSCRRVAHVAKTFMASRPERQPA